MKTVKVIKEKWKTIKIKKQKTNYSVSNFGRIRNDTTGLILKPNYCKNTGYLFVDIHMHGKRYHKRIHRLVAKAFLKKTFHKKMVNHKDADKHNNCILNLEWCTGSQNTKHAIRLGLMTPPVFRGEEHGNSVYTEELVRKICKLLEEGKGTKEIKKTLGFKSGDARTRSLINKIRSRKNWRHISKDYKW